MLNKIVKVLLIEDNDADARFIKEMFKDISKPQYEIVNAKKLEDGLNYLSKDNYDIMLLDLSLPDSMGLETFTKAHEYNSELPIVILSGLDDEEVAVKAVRQGAQDYLMKGDVSGRLLSRAITYAIERKISEQELIENQKDLMELIQQYTTKLKENGVKESERIHNNLETKIESFQKLKDSETDSEVVREASGSIKLFNERVPKSLWLKVAEDFKRPSNKLYVSEKDIKVESTEAGDLENLVEIIKELGERGYFVEEHYVMDLDLNSNSIN
ncbi:MAG: response regulator [Methanobacterium sp.]